MLPARAPVEEPPVGPPPVRWRDPLVVAVVAGVDVDVVVVRTGRVVAGSVTGGSVVSAPAPAVPATARTLMTAPMMPTFPRMPACSGSRHGRKNDRHATPGA